MSRGISYEQFLRLQGLNNVRFIEDTVRKEKVIVVTNW